LTQNTGVEIGGSLYFFHPKKDVSMESYLATSQPLYFFTQPTLAVYVCDLLFKQEINFLSGGSINVIKRAKSQRLVA